LSKFSLRFARENDASALETLIELSTRELQSAYYSPAQLDATIGSIFGVDRALIRDGTYFAAEEDSALIGCGGWSKRKSLFGSDTMRTADDAQLDPRRDAARVRAFFVHPGHARRGVGRAILLACEGAIVAAGFRRIEVVATLAGEPFYLRFDYHVHERCTIALSNGLSLPVVRMTKILDVARATP
jgi:GNAT superfamily N-acetyltransferase